MRYAFAILSVLLLSGCPSVLATLGAAALTRADGYYDTRATQRDIWLARGQQIDNRAIEMLMNIAQQRAVEGDFAAMQQAIDAAREVHRTGQPDLPLIPFTVPPTFTQ